MLALAVTSDGNRNDVTTLDHIVDTVRLQGGRNLRLPRYTQPETGQAIILQLLGWNGPEQPSPRIHAKDSPH